MKKLMCVILIGFGLNVSAEDENGLFTNGIYQIPVQGALALEQIRQDVLDKDWKLEAMNVIEETIEYFKVAESLNSRGLSKNLTQYSNETLLKEGKVISD